LPKDFPPRSTVHSYLQLWSWDGTLEKIHPHLYAACRERGGKEGSPTAAITARRSNRPKKGVQIDPVGYDAGKKTKGVKYHILVDTLGLLLCVAVHAANIQDRDGAALVLDKQMRAMFPLIIKIFADGGYQGERAAGYLRKTGTWSLEIVKRSDTAEGFEVC
jgi:transposase